MLPAISGANQEFILSRRRTFAEMLCEGYHFEINNEIRNSGTRSVYYYKAEHSLIISHVYSSRVHVLNLETGKLRWFDHHGTTVRSVQVCNHEIVTASWDSTVCVTGFDSMELRLRLTEKEMGRCPWAAISPSNDFLYSYSYDSDKNPALTSNTVRKWMLSDGKLEKSLQLPGIHLSIRRCGSCEVYDNRLFVVSDTGNFNIYDCNTGILLSEFYYNDHLQCFCLSRDFNLIAIAGGEGSIYLCDLSGQKILQKRKVHRFDISQLYIHPENPEILISISFDGEMKIWKLPDLELLESVEVSKERLWTVCIVNDHLLTGGEDGDIWIYDIKNLPGIKLKGKLVFADDSYTFLNVESNSFYTTDLSRIQVRRNADGILINDQFAEYLLNTACNFKGFKDLFCSESNDLYAFLTENKGFYQITQ
jgi:WD40 repeat protein